MRIASARRELTLGTALSSAHIGGAMLRHRPDEAITVQRDLAEVNRLKAKAGKLWKPKPADDRNSAKRISRNHKRLAMHTDRTSRPEKGGSK